VLVTGGTGFIGKHLVKALANNGYLVKVLVRKSSNVSILKNFKAELVFGDFSDKNFLGKIVEEGEVIYHLAAMLGEWGIQHNEIYRTNVEYTKKLLEVCLAKKISHFIFCSTPGVIGKIGTKNVSEDLPYNPPYIYEKTKCEAEKIVMKYSRERGFPTTIIRPDFVYGPYDLRRLKLYRAIKNGRFLIVGNGKTYLHPTYIDDVVQGFELVMNKPEAIGQIYNIAGPRPITVNEYIEKICEVLDVQTPRIKVPKILALCAAFTFEGLSKLTRKEPFISKNKVDFLTISHGSDISKAKNQLGYHPKVEFKDGIHKTINWYHKCGLL
jgi:UDP-glucose 4-epimerase